jgi:hypothetical protein
MIMYQKMICLVSSQTLKNYFEEQDEKIDTAVDSQQCNDISSIENALQYWRHPSTNPSHDSKSVCTGPTVDTNDSLDCTNYDKVILTLFPQLFEFVSDLKSELEASMDEVFRLNSDYCPLVAASCTNHSIVKST